MSCPDCFRGSVHTHSEPTGTMETIHGLPTYVAGGSDSTRSKSAIVYLPDAFSLKLVNNKLLADQYAASTGCRVYIPDIVRNGGMDPGLLPKMEVVMGPLEPWSVGGFLHKIYTTLTLLPAVAPFMIFGKPMNAYPRILEYARAVKADLPAGGKLGVAGFCWGAWPSTKLCVETAVEGGSERLIDAQFNGHPSYIVDTPEMVVEAITKFKVPYACAIAAEDFQFNEAAAQKTEAAVREDEGVKTGEGYVYEFKVYKGCKHGFCVRADESSASMEGYRDAVKQAVGWWNKYLN